jgi:hypothetical protein
MTDLLRTGAAWLAAQMKANAGRVVTYCRGYATVALTATVGRTLMRVQDGRGGGYVEWTDRDYLVTAADLVMDGARTEPQRGDLIRDANDAGGTDVFEVLAPGGEPPWRYADPHGLMLRIHTKRVAVEG